MPSKSGHTHISFQATSNCSSIAFSCPWHASVLCESTFLSFFVAPSIQNVALLQLLPSREIIEGYQTSMTIDFVQIFLHPLDVEAVKLCRFERVQTTAFFESFLKQLKTVDNNRSTKRSKKQRFFSLNIWWAANKLNGKIRTRTIKPRRKVFYVGKNVRRRQRRQRNGKLEEREEKKAKQNETSNNVSFKSSQVFSARAFLFSLPLENFLCLSGE